MMVTRIPKIETIKMLSNKFNGQVNIPTSFVPFQAATTRFTIFVLITDTVEVTAHYMVLMAININIPADSMAITAEKVLRPRSNRKVCRGTSANV